MLQQAITADWTGDTRAQRIFASFSANPPRMAAIANEHRWSRADRTFVGFRAEVLAAIRDEVGDKILNQCDVTGDYAEFRRFDTQPSVDDAIMAALSPGAAVDIIHLIARVAA